jgi:hypothetical protein
MKLAKRKRLERRDLTTYDGILSDSSLDIYNGLRSGFTACLVHFTYYREPSHYAVVLGYRRGGRLIMTPEVI